MIQLIKSIESLILALLSIVFPLFVILLTLFSEGIIRLREEYQRTREEKMGTLKELQEKLSTAQLDDDIPQDVDSIKKSFRDLKKTEKGIKDKIDVLNPRKQILKLIIPLIVAYVCSLLFPNIYYNRYLLFTLPQIIFISLLYFFWIIWKSILIIIEAKKLVDEKSGSTNEKIEQILKTIAENTQEKETNIKKIYVTLDGEKFPTKVKLSVNKRQDFKIGISNMEDKMAKKVEIGLTFPKIHFTIEAKPPSYEIYGGKEEIIIRDHQESIHAKTHLLLADSLNITPKKVGSFNIEAFIKGENIITQYHIIKFEVTEQPSNEIL